MPPLFRSGQPGGWGTVPLSFSFFFPRGRAARFPKRYGKAPTRGRGAAAQRGEGGRGKGRGTTYAMQPRMMPVALDEMPGFSQRFGSLSQSTARAKWMRLAMVMGEGADGRGGGWVWVGKPTAMGRERRRAVQVVGRECDVGDEGAQVFAAADRALGGEMAIAEPSDPFRGYG